jgi:hypothetical protein
MYECVGVLSRIQERVILEVTPPSLYLSPTKEERT